ncbi:MAG TPA: hypothetical protein VF817_00860 [Patescibacteria group bacterium]
MSIFLRKSALAVASIAIIGSVLAAGGAQAASDKPSIRSISDKTSNSVVLRLHDGDNKGDRMTVKVRILNTATGKVMFKTFHVKFNDNGNKNVTVTGLAHSTRYSFKVADHPRGDHDFTGYSSSKSATTLN